MRLPRQITFLPSKVNAYLGTSIDTAVMTDILRKMGWVALQEKDKVTVNVLAGGGDVHGHPDICEEIARIYGFNKIPTTTPDGNIVRGGQEYVQSIADSIKTVLTGAGFDEILSLSLVIPKSLIN